MSSEYLLIDGYNIIFAWPELKELAETNMDSARTKLQDILCNYQGYKKNATSFWFLTATRSRETQAQS